MKQRGFTLVEISIVLVIIGTILFALLRSQGVISGAKAKDIVATVSDLRAAVAYFKQRYNYLPGDFPVTNATEIPNVNPPGGNGDGNIGVAGDVNAGTGHATVGTSEVAQAPWHLYNAGFIGTINASDPTSYLRTSYGPVQIVSSAIANALVPGFTATNPGARNAIAFFNLPCDVANEVDLKLDNGNLATGAGMGNVPLCAGSNTLPVYVIAL